MSIKYKIVKTGKPGKTGAESTAYQPRIYNRKTVKADDLIKFLKSRTPVPKSDIVRVLYLFSEAVTELLLDNCSVEIPNLGTLSLTIQGVSVSQPEEITDDAINKLGVAFRPNKVLKQELKKAIFQQGK